MSRFDLRPTLSLAAALVSVSIGVLAASTARSEPLGYAPAYAPVGQPLSIFDRSLRNEPAVEPEQDTTAIPERLRRQIVNYPTREQAGTIVIDTPSTQLYYVLGGGKAVRYGIGVGREGFTWSGVQTVTRKSEWPDWFPPAEMIARQPYLPRFMAGGPSNPLGARAMYLGNTVYRIHGTNAPNTIGGQVSSGCIRMLNEDVIDLYARTNIGTRVVVLPARGVHAAHTVSNARQVVTVAHSPRSAALY